MALSRVEPLEKDIELLIKQDLSPEARSEVLAEFAISSREEAQVTNTHALGRRPDHETFVDGRAGASERAVRPDGMIVYEFDLIEDMFAWVDEQLRTHSPVGSRRDKHPGLYRRSHVFFADGVEANPLAAPPGVEVATFVNSVPYARRIEAGHSPQQPDGVYEVVTALASRRYGNIARVQFGYRAAIGGSIATGVAGNKSAGRFPAIIITVK